LPAHAQPWLVVAALALAALPAVGVLPAAARWLPAAAALLVGTVLGLADAWACRLPPRHFARDWLEAALWSRAHTREGTSFLLLTDYPGQVPPAAWRTFAHRGLVRLFRPPWSMVYTPDRRYNKFFEPIHTYLAGRFPGQAPGNVLVQLQGEDVTWLKSYSGASYGIAYRQLWLPFAPLFHNRSFVVYDLAKPLPWHNWLDRRFGTTVRASSPCHPPPNDAAVLLEGLGHNLVEGRYAAALEVPLPHWVELDLSAPRPIRQVSLHGLDDKNFPVSFALLGKNEWGRPWEVIRRCDANDGPDVTLSLASPVRYRYIRLVVYRTSGQQRLLLRGLEVRGDPDGEEAAPSAASATTWAPYSPSTASAPQA
jgi:hypothetical protein